MENDDIFLRVIRVNMRDLRKRRNTVISFIRCGNILCNYCLRQIFCANIV